MKNVFMMEDYTGFNVCEQAQKYRYLLATAYPSREDLLNNGADLGDDPEKLLDFIYGKEDAKGSSTRPRKPRRPCTVPNLVAISSQSEAEEYITGLRK